MTTQTNTTDRELRFTRILDAPRELVFDVWTQPEHVAKWWGPDGFTLTSQEMDVRPGGVWRFIMHGPDGTDYKNRVVFTHVQRPERLEYKHAGEEEDEDIKFSVTILFEEYGTQTRLDMHMLFATAEELQRVARERGAIEGAEQHLARLAKYVKETPLKP